MKNGTPYQIQLCVEPETQHSPECLKRQIANALDCMSSQSRWQRFASPINRLTDKQLDYLTNLDGKDRVAWCASICADDEERGIALARYVKLQDEKNVAEFAITVVDEFQGQCIGYELLQQLLKTARSNGLEILRGYVLSGNKHMLSLSRRFDASFHSEDSSFIIVDILVTTSVANT